MATSDETLGALKIALVECANDLESEIFARYGATQDIHPALMRKFDRDMAPVRNARYLLRAIGEAG